MARPIEKRLADIQRQATRIEKLQRQQVNGERFVVGALMIAAAKRDPAVRALLIREIENQSMRNIDQRRIAPLLDELRELASSND
ncbi:hypothetical protein [Sphingomonas olei]|uniref:Mobilization protein n=1 Tax=Sphingomonas olei TaxID=1886787 RepID=A0ABY2QEA8_9SPHN|nr:hypothetical protein [Sphingomonas olei]THG37106.1 hypothetical protein E5988_16160 [Sphingomonas olei]